MIDTFTDNAGMIVTNSDFGFLGNLIPIILVVVISWGLCRKPREILFIQFPLALSMRLIFPFFHIGLILFSFALFIMNIIGSKGDLMADVKELPKTIRDNVMEPLDMIRTARKKGKDMIKEDYINKLSERIMRRQL